MLSAASVRAQPVDDAGKVVEATRTLDRNAVWVADRFTYTVAITCRRGVDILLDDLSRDKLRLEGPEVVGVDTQRDDLGDGVTMYQIAYHLTTYRFDPPTQKIGDLTVRYYVKRPGQRLEDSAPAGEVSVPGTIIAVRSLLPDAQETATVRDQRPHGARRPIFALLQPVGIGLIVVSVVPVLAWAAVLLGRARQRKAHRSVRQVRHEERASLDVLRSIDLGTEAGRRDAYDRVSALVRQHLHDVCGVPAEGLTPAEIKPALSARGKDAPIELVTSLLVACDRARYASPGNADAQGSADACRSAIAQAEQVIASVR